MPSMHRRQFIRSAAIGLTLPAAVSTVARAMQAPTTHRVTIASAKFQPTELTLRVGDAVEWVNKDIVPHTATADSSAWDSGILQRGDLARIEFKEVGLVSYFCKLHPSMRATLTVIA